MDNKFIKYLCVILLSITLFFVSIKGLNNIKADSGWDSSYDSGSSWDSSSSWDSGSSWDNDYDYDYDSGSGSSGSSCTTEECRRETLIIMFVIFALTFGVPILIVVTSILNKKVKQQNIQREIQKTFTPIDKEKVNSIIPNFDIEEFNFKAYQIFYDIQIAWMNFDYDKLKDLVTDELYNSYVMQLDALKLKNHKNTMKDFELINSCIFDLKEENGVYIAKVGLNVKFYDYIENVNTGMILRGTANRKLNNTYVLTLIRSKEDTNKINNCPRCGAIVEGNSTGICEYCKSKLINKNYDWVMSKKEKIEQK